jgi:NAD(P)H-hydrate repair Nnr-like enzyme with NAD(P)H-hydrate dehydratase domain
MLAAGLPPVGALAWSVALHAGAGRHLATSTPIGYLASDVARALPHALSEHIDASGSGSP